MYRMHTVCFIASLLAVIVFSLSTDGAKSALSGNKTTIKSRAKQPKKISAAILLGLKSLESSLDKNFESLEVKLDQLTTVVNGTLHESPEEEPSFTSCREIYLSPNSQGNKAYMLKMDTGKIPIYCHMSSTGLGACGGGGWTLALKVNGEQRNFHYDSKLWTNKIDFNLPGGKTGLDRQETKLPSYWNTPFHKICLGMRIGHQVNFIVIHKQANSLYSLIADGTYRATSLGRDTWKRLIAAQASLQNNCNKEGFNAVSDSNVYSKARIGILGNNENDCATCDSRIGIGTGGLQGDSNTCGSEAIPSADNGDKHIKAMGYVLVQ